MLETTIPIEQIVPAEVKISILGKAKASSAESVVKKIEVEDSNGRKKKLYYKRPIEGAFTTSVPLEGRTAEMIAQTKRNEYETAKLCFGDDHVASTMFVVGEDITMRDRYLETESKLAETLGKRPNAFEKRDRSSIRKIAGSRSQIHVYQEPIAETLWNAVGVQTAVNEAMKRGIITSETGSSKFKEERADMLSKIKQKSFTELNPNDPIEGPIRRGLEKYKDVLQDFYRGYVESALMGFIPDLGYINPDINDTVDAGLLFSQNTGITIDGEGQIRIKLIDFGVPRFNVLPIASKERLRSLIKKKKIQGELPIHIVESVYESEGETQQLSEWYRQALINEITESLQTRGGKEMIGIEKNSNVNDIVDKIEDIVLGTQGGVGREYYLELESFRKLCDAPIYGKRTEKK